MSFLEHLKSIFGFRRKRSITLPGPIVTFTLPQTVEEKVIAMRERIAVLEAMLHEYHSNPSVYIDTNTKTAMRWVEELAQLNVQLQVLLDKHKECTIIDRLTTDNDNLLKDLKMANERYQLDVYGLNNEGDPIGGEPPGGFANEAARYKSLWLESRLPEVKHSELILGKYYWEFEALHFPIIVQWNGDPFGRGTKGLRFFGPINPPELPSEETGCANAS